MATHSEHLHQNQRNNEAWRGWLSGCGIVIALIGLFWQPLWLGILGAILGIIAIPGSHSTTIKSWAWIATIVGIIVLILGPLGWTFAAIGY